MSPSTKLDDKLEGIENFHAWTYIIGLILEENDLVEFIKGVVPDPGEDEAKEKYKKYMIIAKRIIGDSITDHLIPQVFSKDTPKEMFDALSRMYEGRNINQKMNLRAQLKSTKMSKGEYIQEYLTTMTTFNGINIPWESYIQKIRARKEILQFDVLWE